MTEENEKSRARSRVWIFVIATVFLVVAVFVANARVERNYRVSAAEHITMKVDSIDFRSDVTRIYANLIGRPHTSQKINAITLKSGMRSFPATDIDGVDFKRWFQWEDDGIIPIEIDFDVMEPISVGTIIIETVRGTDTCVLTNK